MMGGCSSGMEASNAIWDEIEDPKVVSDVRNAVNLVAGSVEHLCEGFPVAWTAVFKTFPWQIFEDSDETLGFFIDRFTSQGKQLWVRASECDGSTSQGRSCCNECRSIPSLRTFRSAELRAQSSTTAHMPYTYLTHEQLSATLQTKSEELTRLRSKVIPSNLMNVFIN
jgi:hypothetical protein